MDSFEETLRSLYVINKNAKKFSNKSQFKYEIGKKSWAKYYSLRKKTLYRLKAEILSKIENKAEKIVSHRIDGKLYYCFYFEEFSFHIPVDDIKLDSKVEDTENLEGFNKDDKNKLNRDLEESLKHIKHELNLSANSYLPKHKVQFNRFNSKSVAFDCLK